MWAGLTHDDWLRRAERVNLFEVAPARWSVVAARERAMDLWQDTLVPSESPLAVVLLGRRVSRAFGLSDARPFSMFQTGGPALGWMPHPSGLNRYWNVPGHVTQAQVFLRSVLADQRREQSPLFHEEM